MLGPASEAEAAVHERVATERAPAARRRTSAATPRLELRDLSRRHEAHRCLLRAATPARCSASWRSRARARTSCSASSRAPAGRLAAQLLVDGAEVRFRHPADAIAAGLVYVPGDRGGGPADAALGPREHRPARSARGCAAGAPSTWPPRRTRRGRHRAAADRHARPGRGAAPLRRQPAEGDHRPLDRRRRAHAALLRPDARHRHPHQAADLPPAARAGGGRARPCCSTPRSWRRCSSPATAPWSSSAAASSARCPPDDADEPALMRAAYGLPPSEAGAAGRRRRRDHGGPGMSARAPRRGQPGHEPSGARLARFVRRNAWVLAPLGRCSAPCSPSPWPSSPTTAPPQLVILAIAALPYAFATAGQTMVVIVGGIDLSVAAMMALTSVTAAVLMEGQGEEFGIVAVAADPAPGPRRWAPSTGCHRAHPGAGHRGHAGLVLRLAGRGAADPGRARRRGGDWLRDSSSAPSAASACRQRSAQWLPKALLLLVVCLGVVWIPLKRSRLGCRSTPSGPTGWRPSAAASRSTARRSPPMRSCGLFAAMGGLVLTMSTGIGTPIPGPYLLASVAAVVLGGVSLGGGRGGLVGPIVAVFILRLVRQDLTLLSVDPNVAQVVEGLIMVSRRDGRRLRGHAEPPLMSSTVQATASRPGRLSSARPAQAAARPAARPADRPAARARRRPGGPAARHRQRALDQQHRQVRHPAGHPGGRPDADHADRRHRPVGRHGGHHDGLRDGHPGGLHGPRPGDPAGTRPARPWPGWPTASASASSASTR